MQASSAKRIIRLVNLRITIVFQRLGEAGNQSARLIVTSLGLINLRKCASNLVHKCLIFY